MRLTGYEPLNTPKPVAPDLWVIDGPAVRFHGLPFSTRATVIRLDNGDLWVHSPTQLTDALRCELGALGPVRHLVAPNRIHYVHIADWQAAWPDATAWAAPDVVARAAKHGLALRFDHDLGEGAEKPWQDQIDQMIVEGSMRHREAVFFHRSSATLILTDLIENFETEKLPAWMRPLIWIAGLDAPRGRMPPDMYRSFRDKARLAQCIETMIGWEPQRILLAHGRWFESDGVAQLERAFRPILQDRRWHGVLRRIERDRQRGNPRG